MITIVTGMPGAGKTLWTVKQLVDKYIPTGRKIVTNIAGFNHPSENVTVDHDPDLPMRWEEYENGTLFIFDEVQRQYPPRHSTAKIPPYISAYQTHRHRGFDFYFVTQGPKLIDRGLWDLIGEHVHLYRAFGMKRTRIRRWGNVNPDPNPPQTNASAINTGFVFPKKYFQFYTSASMHTDKLNIPWKPFLVLLLCFATLLGSGYFVYRFVFDRVNSEEPVSSAEQNLREIVDCPFRLMGNTSKSAIFYSDGAIFEVSADVGDVITLPNGIDCRNPLRSVMN